MADFAGHYETFSQGGVALAPGAEPVGRAKQSLRIEFGRRRLSAEEVRALSAGAVVSLEAASKDEVDVYLDGRLIARGELAAFKGKMCIRVTQVIRDQAKINR